MTERRNRAILYTSVALGIAIIYRDQMETLILDTTLDALNNRDERLQTALAASEGKD